MKSITQRSGLLKLDEIARMFCFEKDMFLKKWHAGEPIIRDVQLRSLGENYVADERHVWNVLERFKDSLELAVPRWRDESQRHPEIRVHRQKQITAVNEIKDEILTIAQIRKEFKGVFSVGTLNRRQREGLISPCRYSNGKTGKRYFKRSAIEKLMIGNEVESI